MTLRTKCVRSLDNHNPPDVSSQAMSDTQPLNPQPTHTNNDDQVIVPGVRVKSNYAAKNSGKRYSPAQKLAVKALLAAGKTPTEIERSEKMDRSTVYDVMKDHRVDILPPKVIDDIKRSLIGSQYGNAHRAQLKITDAKLDAMNAYQLSLITSINVDKARLMENLSTENISHRGVMESIDAERQKLIDKMNALDEPS